MSATARKHEPIEPEETPDLSSAQHASATEYVTRGAKALRNARPHLRIVSPLRPERASRGIFALVVSAVLVAGMGLVLVINTSLAQGAFTVSELKAEKATLQQQEQALAEEVAAAAAPDQLAHQARAMGMVPAATPVFINVKNGKVLGKPKAAVGATGSRPVLMTPADATVAEATDAEAVSLPEGYDPAAADAAAAAAAATTATDSEVAATLVDPTAVDAQAGAPKAGKAGGKAGSAKANGGKGAGGKAGGKAGQTGVWEDSTILDVTSKVSSTDAGLDAVPVAPVG